VEEEKNSTGEENKKSACKGSGIHINLDGKEQV
jgi:hypothetical protein